MRDDKVLFGTIPYLIEQLEESIDLAKNLAKDPSFGSKEHSEGYIAGLEAALEIAEENNVK